MEPIAQPDLDAALDRMWAKFLPELEKRVAFLERANAALAAGTLNVDLRAKANAAAHKLAGVLGTFGLASGTVLARQIEALYSPPNSPGLLLPSQLIGLSTQLRALVENRNQAGALPTSYTLKK